MTVPDNVPSRGGIAKQSTSLVFLEGDALTAGLPARKGVISQSRLTQHGGLYMLQVYHGQYLTLGKDGLCGILP